MTSSKPGRLAVTSRHPSSGRSPCRSVARVVGGLSTAPERPRDAERPSRPKPSTKPLSPIESCSSQDVPLLLRRTSTHYP